MTSSKQVACLVAFVVPSDIARLPTVYYFPELQKICQNRQDILRINVAIAKDGDGWPALAHVAR